MPNHCENRLSVYCQDPETAKATLADMGEVEKGGGFRIDFNRLIPMPEILKKTRSGFRDFEVDGETIKAQVWIADHPDEFGEAAGERLPTEEEAAEIAATGGTSWYDWSCNNWGTKWNAYDQNNEVDKEGGRFIFNTAWGPPTPWLKKLEAKYPGVHFSGVYVIEFDEGAGDLFPPPSNVM